MEPLSIITLIFLVGFMILAILLIQQFNKGLHQIEKGVNEKLNWVTEQVDGRLRDNSQSLQSTSIELGSKLESAARAVTDVHEHLGKLEESHRRIYEVGKDISSLQDLLRTPKLRGGIGEFFLEDLLKQVMPREYFALQHEFKSRDRVDAVIKFGQGIVPIDAKFPLENFQKYVKSQDEKENIVYRKQFINDVKEHIKKISEKYIQPDEGTFDFALMYIPAENVYYETIIKDERTGHAGLFQYAISKKVIPVSPNSFYAYLRVILLGLKGMAVEKGAKLIIQNISKVKNELNRFYDDFTKVGKHLSNSKSSYDDAEKHLGRLSDKLGHLESPAIKEAIPEIVD